MKSRGLAGKLEREEKRKELTRVRHLSPSPPRLVRFMFWIFACMRSTIHKETSISLEGNIQQQVHSTDELIVPDVNDDR